MQITLSPKQNEYIREANARWNIKQGAVRSGKSYVDMAYVAPYHIRRLRNESGLNVVLGVSKSTIERNVLQPMRELYGSSIVGGINNENIARICGQEVYCLGAEKANQVSKIQGSSIKYCYGDEIAKWNKDVFAMLQSRLDKPYSRFDGSCNPENPGHWFKKFLEREDIDKYVQDYTIFDNPFLTDEFVENLCKEYQGTVFYDRYILGLWALAEGLIYPMYEDALEDIPTDVQISDYYLSIDYGTMNAFAALLWAKGTNGTYYAIKGYYYSGREKGILKTDEEYGTDLNGLVKDVVEKYDRLYGKGMKKIKTIVDPSAASFITLLRKLGHYSVIPANNAVLDGIRDTASAIQTNKIKGSTSIKEWKTEAQGYIWDETVGDDRPVKVNDHYMDATRYLVETLGIAIHKTIYKPLWN